MTFPDPAVPTVDDIGLRCEKCARCAGCHKPSCTVASLSYCRTGSCDLTYWDRPLVIAALRSVRAEVATLTAKVERVTRAVDTLDAVITEECGDTIKPLINGNTVVTVIRAALMTDDTGGQP